MADVTLDNEGPETNNGSGYKYMRAQEKAKSKSRRLDSPQLAPVSTLSAMMTPCVRDQLDPPKVRKGLTIDSCQQATQESPSTGTILHETIVCN